MQGIYIFAFTIALFTIVQSSLAPNKELGESLSELVTKELATSYSYLQLSSKLGANNAYPGFSSLFIKLSDEDSSKGHELVKFLALRKFNLTRLIQKSGIKVEGGLPDPFDLRQSLKYARNRNSEVWAKVKACHDNAQTHNDANVQDYLEAHLLDHHIDIEKLLTDIEHRIDDAQPSEQKLIIFMIDEELLQTYGDRRKDIFS